MLAIFLVVAAIDGLHNWGHDNTPATNTITVTGEGKATAIPDTSVITFSVEENASSVAAAQESATKRVDAALAALKKEGVADEDVRTTSYNVNPQYANTPCGVGIYCPQNTSKITGYQVSQRVEVKVHDTSKTGNVLQDLGTLGVQNISGPDLTVSDEDAVKSEARGEAITKARAQAQMLAKQLGVHLGKVVGFSENAGGQPYPMYAAGKSILMDQAVSSPAAPSVPTGQNEYTSNVSITYEVN